MVSGLKSEKTGSYYRKHPATALLMHSIYILNRSSLYCKAYNITLCYADIQHVLHAFTRNKGLYTISKNSFPNLAAFKMESANNYVFIILKSVHKHSWTFQCSISFSVAIWSFVGLWVFWFFLSPLLLICHCEVQKGQNTSTIFFYWILRNIQKHLNKQTNKPLMCNKNPPVPQYQLYVTV